MAVSIAINGNAYAVAVPGGWSTGASSGSTSGDATAVGVSGNGSATATATSGGTAGSGASATSVLPGHLVLDGGSLTATDLIALVRSFLTQLLGVSAPAGTPLPVTAGTLTSAGTGTNVTVSVAVSGGPVASGSTGTAGSAGSVGGSAATAGGSGAHPIVSGTWGGSPSGSSSVPGAPTASPVVTANGTGRQRVTGGRRAPGTSVPTSPLPPVAPGPAGALAGAGAGVAGWAGQDTPLAIAIAISIGGLADAVVESAGLDPRDLLRHELGVGPRTSVRLADRRLLRCSRLLDLPARRHLRRGHRDRDRRQRRRQLRRPHRNRCPDLRADRHLLQQLQQRPSAPSAAGTVTVRPGATGSALSVAVTAAGPRRRAGHLRDGRARRHRRRGLPAASGGTTLSATSGTTGAAVAIGIAGAGSTDSARSGTPATRRSRAPSAAPAPRCRCWPWRPAAPRAARCRSRSPGGTATVSAQTGASGAATLQLGLDVAGTASGATDLVVAPGAGRPGAVVGTSGTTGDATAIVVAPTTWVSVATRSGDSGFVLGIATVPAVSPGSSSVPVPATVPATVPAPVPPARAGPGVRDRAARS